LRCGWSNVLIYGNSVDHFDDFIEFVFSNSFSRPAYKKADIAPFRKIG